MKICYDNLKNVHLSKNGNLILKTKNSQKTLIYREKCIKCGDAYLTFKNKPSEFCSYSCNKKDIFKKENNPNWKGGIDYTKPQRKKHYLKNREQILLKNKEWRKNNNRQEYRQKYYKENIERCQKYGREYRRQHIEERREYDKEWRKNNPEKHCAKEARRRAIKLKQTPDLTQEEKQQIIEIYSHANRLGPEWQVEHIIALANGGLHHPNNLQITTRRYNLKKGARLNFRDPLDWEVI